jgi:hypothetical protein
MQMIGLLVLKLAPSGDSDHIFSESRLLIDNSEGDLQTIVLCNKRSVRPDLALSVSGLEWIRDPGINYSIRGTYVNS